MWWPTREDLEALQLEAVAMSGGTPGVHNSSGLEAALGRPLTFVFGTELFSTLEDKVAALMHSIITTHVFNDANKRTGSVAGVLVLRKNGRVLLDNYVGGLENLALAIACGEMNEKDITNWIRCRLL